MIGVTEAFAKPSRPMDHPALQEDKYPANWRAFKSNALQTKRPQKYPANEKCLAFCQSSIEIPNSKFPEFPEYP
jgi:hypothetical protein